MRIVRKEKIAYATCKCGGDCSSIQACKCGGDCSGFSCKCGGDC